MMEVFELVAVVVAGGQSDSGVESPKTRWIKRLSGADQISICNELLRRLLR